MQATSLHPLSLRQDYAECSNTAYQQRVLVGKGNSPTGLEGGNTGRKKAAAALCVAIDGAGGGGGGAYTYAPSVQVLTAQIESCIRQRADKKVQGDGKGKQVGSHGG